MISPAYRKLRKRPKKGKTLKTLHPLKIIHFIHFIHFVQGGKLSPVLPSQQSKTPGLFGQGQLTTRLGRGIIDIEKGAAGQTVVPPD